MKIFFIFICAITLVSSQACKKQTLCTNYKCYPSDINGNRLDTSSNATYNSICATELYTNGQGVVTVSNPPLNNNGGYT